VTLSTRRSIRHASRFLTVLLIALLILPAGCKEEAAPPVAQPSEPAPEPVEPTPPPIVIVEPIEPVYEPLFGLPAHVTDNYVIYSDAKPELLADAAMRLEAFRDEYRRQMADVFKPFNGKAKALFIADQETFVAAGGEPHAPGIFRVYTDAEGNIADEIGPRLVIRNSGNNIYLEVSQLMQHEGWHQFCWNHVQQFIPIWLDEGLATYYSYGMWTGDSMIYGGLHFVIYQNLMQCLPAFVPLQQLLTLDDGMWRAYQEQVGFWPPYMEAFSVVQYLKHANGGANAHLLDAYIADVAAGRDLTASATAIAALESDWLQWVQSLQPTHTHARFFESISAMLTAHLVRCHLNGQDFETMDQFLAAKAEGELALGDVGSDTWLPRSIMDECLRLIKMFGNSYAQYGELEMIIEDAGGGPAARVRISAIGLDVRATATVTDGRVSSLRVHHLIPPQANMQ
jgi:hypothetical protein